MVVEQSFLNPPIKRTRTTFELPNSKKNAIIAPGISFCEIKEHDKDGESNSLGAESDLEK